MSEHNHHQAEIKQNHWEKELEKRSLREPPLVSKFKWLKPLTIFQSLEFRGLDTRDFYKAPEYDEWDIQAWNVRAADRATPCVKYMVDLEKCKRYVKSEFALVKTSLSKRTNYCWKIQDNFSNCQRAFIRKHKRFLADEAVLPEDH